MILIMPLACQAEPTLEWSVCLSPMGSTRSPCRGVLLPSIPNDLNCIVDNWDQFGYNGGAAAQKPDHLQRVGSLGGALQETA
jgi:hypothetical protein